VQVNVGDCGVNSEIEIPRATNKPYISNKEFTKDVRGGGSPPAASAVASNGAFRRPLLDDVVPRQGQDTGNREHQGNECRRNELHCALVSSEVGRMRALYPAEIRNMRVFLCA
jgi:hypothetical protein